MLYRPCILFCCCVFIGCGSPEPYDVRAVVTLDGNPLTEAEVSLVPVWGNTVSAAGVTDTTGAVTFKTGGIDGVLPNSYIVVVSKTVEERKLTNNEIRALAAKGIPYSPNIIEFVPEKYTRRETSDLKLKVGYWHHHEFMLDLLSEKSPP